MTTPHDDADWLGTADTLPAPATDSEPPPSPFAVKVYSGPCDADPAEYPTLHAAWADTRPASPSARIIRVHDTAMVGRATEKHTGWELTQKGERQVLDERAAMLSGRAA